MPLASLAAFAKSYRNRGFVQMRLLNLFSGTDSVAMPWRENNHEVVSVDIDPRYQPEINEDILQVAYCKIPVPDIIWASPPCDQYSRCRTRGPPRNLVLADSLVAKAIEIIQYFEKLNPSLIWFIENGDSTLLWTREVAKDLKNYVVLDYCAYGKPFRKRTRLAISDNLTWIPRPLCNPKTCAQCVDGKKHIKTAQRGQQSTANQKRDGDTCTLDELHGLPRELTEEILAVCNNQLWQLV